MNETDTKDSRDNIIISPGLKVRHKKSQFEYTVDSVTKEPNGKITIMLQMPEEPRFEPAEEETIISDGNNSQKDILYEADPVDDLSSIYFIPNEGDVEEGDLLAVDSDEFEKEYEVK